MHVLTLARAAYDGLAVHGSVVFTIISLLALSGAAFLMAPIPTDDMVKYLIKLGLLDSAGGYQHQYPAASADKTANYNVADTDPSGTLFTNRGAAGAVTFTLPAVTPARRGRFYRFVGVADQNIVVAAAAGAAVALNSAAATSLTCSTAGQKIGALILAECDGTKWILSGVSVGVTYAVA